jgi:hypothetical protein
MVKVLVLAALCVGCSTGAWRVADGASLALSTAGLAADAVQTCSAALDGWSLGRRELNPIYAGNPSCGEVTLYHASVALFNAGLWLALPPRWRSIIPGFIIGVQAQSVVHNLRSTYVLGVGNAALR